MCVVFSKVKRNTIELTVIKVRLSLYLSFLFTPSQVKKMIILEILVIGVGFLSLSLTIHYRCGLSHTGTREKST